MSRLFSVVMLTFLVISSVAVASEVVPQGKVFSHFTVDLRSDEERGGAPRSEFDLKRAYLGAKGKLSSDLGFKITYDVSHNEEGFSAFAKIAELSWKHLIPQSTLVFGLTGTHTFGITESAWAHRGVQKSGPDFWSLRPSADLGLSLISTVSDELSVDVGLFNGEGYKQREKDGFKVFQVRPVIQQSRITISPYMDYTQFAASHETMNQVMLGGFVGYKRGPLQFGIDTLIQSRNDVNALLIWGFVRYFINDQSEAFARVDYYTPDQDKADADAQLVIVGLAHTPAEGVEIAVDYQFTQHDGMNRGQVYIHTTYSF